MPPQSPVLAPKPSIEEETDLIPPYQVVLLNDDVTTFDFVIWLLMTLFAKPAVEAGRLTWEIHNTGAAAVCTTTKERAELYVEQVRALARPRGFPLEAVIEPA